ncbi:MFS transporter [Kiloniella sp. b19]|uniref:MFS transporter n=1 Tax=Kiloniella sp. GXU_MW_B19 TaxID=3141326 RepID=UPI0031CF4416
MTGVQEGKNPNETSVVEMILPEEEKQPYGYDNKPNVLVLALCQALGMSSASMMVSISALVGSSLADDSSLQTLPLSLQFLAMMIFTMPLSGLMGRYGRRLGFSLGAGVGVIAGILSAQAILMNSFLLFCVGSFLFGFSASAVFYYRFAAADAAPQNAKAKAISLVMAGGVLAAILGPEIAKWSKDLLSPVLFAGSFYAMALLSFLSLVALQLLNIPAGPRKAVAERVRSFAELLRQPVVVVAMMGGVVSFSCMNLVMSITTTAMIACAFPFDDAAFVIQWHILSMYAPSFFTGQLIRRFGVLMIMALGLLMLIMAATINLSGIDFLNFWFGLVMLGLGWNFLYVGGSTLLTYGHRPEEKSRVQGLNELVTFAVVAVTSFSSGWIYDALGWNAINLIVFVPLTLMTLGLIWLTLRFRRGLEQPV